MTARPVPSVPLTGAGARGSSIAVLVVSFGIYGLANSAYDAGRGDFFYLADAFLHGRTWLDVALGPWDIIRVDDRVYVPFAPFPAIALMPIVALVGPQVADAWEPLINAGLATAAVGLCWMLLDRIGVPRRTDRIWLTILFGFSTQLLWVTTRGGVWHTGHLVATILTLACLIELWGSRRAWVVGLLAGAAFLSRPPLAFAVPVYALMLMDVGAFRSDGGLRRALDRIRGAVPWRHWLLFGAAVLPSVAFFFIYNALRFGTPLEAGYGLAMLPEFLERQRSIGLFSLAHVPTNLDYFLVHLPRLVEGPPYLLPDGLGLSVLITSPGLLFAFRADWADVRVRLLAGASILVLIPTLLYYGGGWLQFGYRYFLDSVPFVIALCGLAAVHRASVSPGWKALIAFGTIVMALSVPFAYRS